MRLLPRLSPALLARAPKLLVGFSDVTALHVLWQRARVTSVHGAMAATTEALTRYEFGEAARAGYDFFWNEFADWYIEAAKVRLQLLLDTREIAVEIEKQPA